MIFECNLKLGNDYSSLNLPPTNPYTYSNIVQANGANVRVDAWTFQKSIEAKIPRTEFYSGSGIIVIVSEFGQTMVAEFISQEQRLMRSWV